MGAIATAQRILDAKQYEEIDGVIIDVQTAKAITVVAAALNETNRAKLDGLSVARAGEIAWKCVK